MADVTLRVLHARLPARSRSGFASAKAGLFVVYHAPSRDVVLHAPSRDVVYHTPSRDVVFHAPSRDVVFHAPSRDVVFHAPSRDVITAHLGEVITAHLGEALLVCFALVTLATLFALMVL